MPKNKNLPKILFAVLAMVFLLITSFSIASAASSLNFLSRGQADSLYCGIDSGCNSTTYINNTVNGTDSNASALTEYQDVLHNLTALNHTVEDIKLNLSLFYFNFSALSYNVSRLNSSGGGSCDNCTCSLSPFWCFQETANISESCGASDRGSYASEGVFQEGNEVQYAYDTDYDTYIFTGDGNPAIIYINYSNDFGSNGAFWKIKNYYEIKNISIPGYCFRSILQLKVTSHGYPLATSYYCNNGSDWFVIYEKILEYESPAVRFYEEGIYWLLGAKSELYVQRSGDNMTGNLNMTGNNISNVGYIGGNSPIKIISPLIALDNVTAPWFYGMFNGSFSGNFSGSFTGTLNGSDVETIAHNLTALNGSVETLKTQAVPTMNISFTNQTNIFNASQIIIGNLSVNRTIKAGNITVNGSMVLGSSSQAEPVSIVLNSKSTSTIRVNGGVDNSNNAGCITLTTRASGGSGSMCYQPWTTAFYTTDSFTFYVGTDPKLSIYNNGSMGFTNQLNHQDLYFDNSEAYFRNIYSSFYWINSNTGDVNQYALGMTFNVPYYTLPAINTMDFSLAPNYGFNSVGLGRDNSTFRISFGRDSNISTFFFDSGFGESPPTSRAPKLEINMQNKTLYDHQLRFDMKNHDIININNITTHTVIIDSLAKAYIGGSAYTCIYDNGSLFSSEIACP